MEKNDIINNLKNAIAALESSSTPNTQKIGIAINTHNRPTMLAKCLENMDKFAPEGSIIVVVDDASNTNSPRCNFKFDKNVCISKAKNKSIELLYLAGCDHLFLFDDDTYPISYDWWKPYVQSKEPHLMYIFQTFKNGGSTDPNSCRKLFENEEIVAYSKPRGCMLYFDRKCIDEVGGMHEGFGRWGWEHVDLSDRIYNAGLTSFSYMDVVGSSSLIFSDDEHSNNANTTVRGDERKALVEANSRLYESRFGIRDYEPFMKKRNIFLTCLFNGVDDPQRRNGKVSVKDAVKLMTSIPKDSHLVILYDSFTEEDIKPVSAFANVEFVKVGTGMNPYFQRWASYRNYLLKNIHTIENVICVDATDVVILSNPDWDIVNSRLVVGDEISMLDDPAKWMRNNHKGSIMDDMFKESGNTQLLNAGVLGGNVSTVISFCSKLMQVYQEHGALHVTDMGIFNYVCRKYFKTMLYHGRTVTTPFKEARETSSMGYAWIKHK